MPSTNGRNWKTKIGELNSIADRGRTSSCALEAAPGLEPGITDLQSVALPLGYAARMRALEDTGTRAAVKDVAFPSSPQRDR